MSVPAGMVIVGLLLLAGLSTAGCDLFAGDDDYEQKENEVYVTIPEPPEGPAVWRELRVFYDKGNYDDNWRYLEACAADSGYYQWATSRTRIPGATDPGYGAGEANTALLDVLGSTSFLTLYNTPSFWTSTEGTALLGGTDTAYVLRVQPTGYFFEPYTYIKEARYKDYAGCKVIAARRF